MGVLIAIGLTLVAAWPSAARAQGPIQVELVADRDQLTIGDVVELRLRVTHPSGYRVAPRRLPQTWGAFEVRSQSQPQTRDNGDGTQETTQVIEAALFSTGTFETPDLAITLQDDAGELFEELAPTVSLEVLSVLGQDDSDLRDIRPQASLPLPALWPWILAGTLSAIAAGAVAFLLYRRMRGVARQPVFVSVLDTRSPYDRVLDELAHIETLDLLEQGRFNEHYTLVSEALRRYLEGTYGLLALDQTTDELRSSLREIGLGFDRTRQVVELLNECDLVKFARFTPEMTAARRLTGRVRPLVELIRPPPAVEPGVMTTVGEGAA